MSRTHKDTLRYKESVWAISGFKYAYTSRRFPRKWSQKWLTTGRYWKQLTHRYERRQAVTEVLDQFESIDWRYTSPTS